MKIKVELTIEELRAHDICPQAEKFWLDRFPTGVGELDWTPAGLEKMLRDLMEVNREPPPAGLPINWLEWLSDRFKLRKHLSQADLSGLSLQELELRNSDLNKIKFSKSRLAWADFTESDLSYADFSGANLADTSFIGARLYGAMLRDAFAQKAVFDHAFCRLTDFRGANLKRANFSHTEVYEADFSGANLQGAIFMYSQLFETKLFGANLQEAHIEECDLTQAAYDDATVWPAGFDPQEAGCVKFFTSIKQG